MSVPSSPKASQMGSFSLGVFKAHLTTPLPFGAPRPSATPACKLTKLGDSPSDVVFASIANLTNGKFISVGSLSGAVMPVAFQATLAPVPEISALFPIIGLIAAVAVTQVLRRRRIAQLRAATPTIR